MDKTTKPAWCKAGKMDCLFRFLPLILAVALWVVLSTYESALLFRVNELSVFLFDGQYFTDMMSAPAGMLHYVSSFFVQFFYYPALGAAIYVLMLYAVYALAVKVFSLQGSYRMLALLPVVAIVASNAQLGYWIFYLKQPGYYYMALLSTLLLLLALLVYRRMNEPLRMAVVVLWCVAGYPLAGAWALVGAVVMGCYSVASAVGDKRSPVMPAVTLLLAVAAAVAVPHIYYRYYTTVCTEYMYGAGLPITQWVHYYVKKVEHEESSYWHNVYLYWIPYIVLLLSVAGLCVVLALRSRLSEGKWTRVVVGLPVMLFILLFLWVFWYNDNNFRIENKQNKAMWERRWRDVSEYSRDAVEPTRQIVMNKNAALFKQGTAMGEMFSYPDGSSDILAPMAVHLTQTGGKMLYFQYGKFNFSYRWCMEDAVEYGWRYEYLKHAARSMLLAGEYRLTQRYVDILKRTLFYRGFASDIEKCIKDPSLIEKEREYAMPIQMACYPDNLGVDESFVEVYLTKEFRYIPDEASRMYLEVALMSAMIRKDVKAFWFALERYLNEYQPERLPKNLQEGVLLFLNLDKGETVSVGPAFVDRFISKAVQRRLEMFVGKTKQFKGMKEAEMAPHFKEYKDTYFYFYFFVRKIKTN